MLQFLQTSQMIMKYLFLVVEGTKFKIIFRLIRLDSMIDFCLIALFSLYIILVIIGNNNNNHIN